MQRLEPYYLKPYNNCVDFVELVLRAEFGKTLGDNLQTFRKDNNNLQNPHFYRTIKPLAKKHKLPSAEVITDGLVVSMAELKNYATHIGLTANGGILHYYGKPPSVQWCVPNRIIESGLRIVGYYTPKDYTAHGTN